MRLLALLSTAEISKSYFIYCPLLSRARSAYTGFVVSRYSRKADWGCTAPPPGLGDEDGSVREGGDAVVAAELLREHQNHLVLGCLALMLMLSVRSL